MKRKTDNFNKFYNKKNNAAIKEAFRQEKKAAKKERKEAIEKHFEEKRKAREERFGVSPQIHNIKAGAPGAAKIKGGVQTPKGAAPHDPNALPLNKYIAHGGLCSRRDAAELIRLGKVQVNGQLVTEPGTKVSPTDFVQVNGKKVTISRNFIYILLNKPKDYITTTDDPQGRKTVLDLIRQATTERVYPVGRLDRNTSGVLLLTNDGDLSQKLAHPSHEIKKIYHVTLDKPLVKGDFDKIAAGIQLEDGIAYVDVLAYADAKDKTQIGLEIHSGRNRIVRRIFEHLGYDVRGLDRVMYAGLTKKNVQRGHWRLLTEKEIRILKYLNASFRGSLSAPKSQAQKNDQKEETAPVKAPHAHTGTGYQKPTTEGSASKDHGSKKDHGPKKNYGPKKPFAAASGDRKSSGPERSNTSDPHDRKTFGATQKRKTFVSSQKPKASGPSDKTRKGFDPEAKNFSRKDPGAGPDKPFDRKRPGGGPAKPFTRKPRTSGPSKPRTSGPSKPKSSTPGSPIKKSRRPH